MKKTDLPSDDMPNDPELLQKAEDVEFRIKVISSIIVMIVIIIIVIAGKFVVKQINSHSNEETVPIEKLEPEITTDFDTDTIITEDELKELNESLDDILKNFTESNNDSTP